MSQPLAGQPRTRTCAEVRKSQRSTPIPPSSKRLKEGHGHRLHRCNPSPDSLRGAQNLRLGITRLRLWMPVDNCLPALDDRRLTVD